MKNLLALSSLLLLAPSAAAQEEFPADSRKFRVEGPIKTLMIPPLARSTTTTAAAAPQAGLDAPRVAWHANPDAAKAAAAESKKPILLFQLLGKLDDEFC